MVQEEDGKQVSHSALTGSHIMLVFTKQLTLRFQTTLFCICPYLAICCDENVPVMKQSIYFARGSPTCKYFCYRCLLFRWQRARCLNSFNLLREIVTLLLLNNLQQPIIESLICQQVWNTLSKPAQGLLLPHTKACGCTLCCQAGSHSPAAHAPAVQHSSPPVAVEKEKTHTAAGNNSEHGQLASKVLLSSLPSCVTDRSWLYLFKCIMSVGQTVQTNSKPVRGKGSMTQCNNLNADALAE